MWVDRGEDRHPRLLDLHRMREFYRFADDVGLDFLIGLAVYGNSDRAWGVNFSYFADSWTDKIFTHRIRLVRDRQCFFCGISRANAPVEAAVRRY